MRVWDPLLFMKSLPSPPSPPAPWRVVLSGPVSCRVSASGVLVLFFKGNKQTNKKQQREKKKRALENELLFFLMDSVCQCSPRRPSVSLPTCYSVLFPDVSSFLVGGGGSTWGRRRKEIGSPYCSSLLPSAASVNLEGSWPFLPLYSIEVLVLQGPAAVPTPL